MLFSSWRGFSPPCIGVALLGCCITVQASGETSAAAQSIALEIIVTFAGDSEPGRRVERILREHPADLSGLAGLQARLHRATGVALEPERVTSGAELIFRIPEQPLLEAVRQTVSRNAQVSSTALVAIQRENPRLPETLLLLHFRETSEEAGLLDKALGEGLPTGSACKRWRRGSAAPVAFRYGAARKRNPRWPSPSIATPCYRYSARN